MGFRPFLRRAFEKLVREVLRLGRAALATPQEKRTKRWFEAEGDRTHRVRYPLTSNSLVFDLGGYEGQWASDIFGRYCCTVRIFEPMPEFARAIEERFENNPSIIVHPFGLGAHDATIELSVAADRTSSFGHSERRVRGEVRKASEFLDEIGSPIVDLMKINIEGGEYDLLEHLLEVGCVTRIRNLQIQFHDFVPDAEPRMRAIQAALGGTHHLTYQYPWVWENWELTTTPGRP